MSRGILRRYAAAWHFQEPIEEIWPVLGDTARLNEATGLPKYTLIETPNPDGSVQRIGTAKLGRHALEWEELPVEWVMPTAFRQERRFRKGPLVHFQATFTAASEGDGTVVQYAMEADAANWAGRLLLATGFLKKAVISTEKLIRQMVANRRETTATAIRPITLPTGARERADTAVTQLTEGGHALGRRLADFLLTGSENDLERIRPWTLARTWGEPRREVIELCLGAVKAGLLTSRWDMLCPRCRGAKLTVPSLDQLPRTTHCPSCNVSYGRDFTSNVELTFSPAAAIRPIGTGGYCLSGPLTTPHVALQQRLEPGATLDLDVDLPPGAWRIRTIELGGDADIESDGAWPEIILDGDEVSTGALQPRGHIRAINRSQFAKSLVLERREWVKDALTAHQATTMQAFRDLFATDSLRPGDDVAIDQVTLLFTDLKGSTALYHRLGDAPAYHLVRDHYAYLTRLIREHDGAIVKTIGDAVMAAFADPAQAVAAALAAQQQLGSLEHDGMQPLILKIGLHAGACIAVTLNDRLDYFGTTVNLAARVQQQSRGGDIVLSATLAADPVVAQLIKDCPAFSETAQVKGFVQAVDLLRLHLPASITAGA